MRMCRKYLWSDQLGEEGKKIRHRFMHSPSEHTRMQILSRTGDGDFEVRQSSESVRYDPSQDICE